MQTKLWEVLALISTNPSVQKLILRNLSFLNNYADLKFVFLICLKELDQRQRDAFIPFVELQFQGFITNDVK